MSNLHIVQGFTQHFIIIQTLKIRTIIYSIGIHEVINEQNLYTYNAKQLNEILYMYTRRIVSGQTYYGKLIKF